MIIAGARDPFGFGRIFYHPATGVCAGSIREVLQASDAAVDRIDAQAIQGYFSGMRLADRTLLCTCGPCRQAIPCSDRRMAR